MGPRSPDFLHICSILTSQTSFSTPSAWDYSIFNSNFLWSALPPRWAPLVRLNFSSPDWDWNLLAEGLFLPCEGDDFPFFQCHSEGCHKTSSIMSQLQLDRCWWCKLAEATIPGNYLWNSGLIWWVIWGCLRESGTSWLFSSRKGSPPLPLGRWSKHSTFYSIWALWGDKKQMVS